MPFAIINPGVIIDDSPLAVSQIESEVQNPIFHAQQQKIRGGAHFVSSRPD